MGDGDGDNGHFDAGYDGDGLMMAMHDGDR